MSADATAAPSVPSLIVPDAPPVFASVDLPMVQSAEPPATPGITDSQHRRNVAAAQMARQLVEDKDGNTTLPAAAPAAKPAASKPTEPVETKPVEKQPAEVKTEPRANTVTERISDLTRKNRELVTARKSAEAQLAAKDEAIAKAVADAKAAGAKEYKDSLRQKFKADAPGTIREELEEDWVAVLERVAEGGPLPTAEELAAKDQADRMAKAEEARVAEFKAATDRVQKLEDERAKEKKDRDDAKKAEDAAAAELASQKQLANSHTWIAENLIDPVKHPNLVNIREDVAEEAFSEVARAMSLAVSTGKRELGRDGKPKPWTEDETIHFTRLAIDGLQNYYADLFSRSAPGSASSAPQTATATETAPAVVTPPSVPQSRPPTTITSAVAGGETLRAANPVARSTLDAKEAAIAAARKLPPLSTE